MELVRHRGGEVLAGRWALESPAGTGGMGTVYRGRDLESGAAVAVKLVEGDPERALREAALLASLDHPGVVRYLGHGRLDDGVLYLVMEWLEGEDLQARLLRGALGVAESVALVGVAARALASAHARGVVHRDIKPSNLFLVGGAVEGVKVIDFGIARATGGPRPTRTGVLMGTPGYMAPEQASRGARELDARADVFALGCVLFECLTGRAAFAGDDLLAVLAKILLDEAPRPSQLERRVPAALDELIARMLAKRPESRPADGAEVAALLERLDGPEAVSATPLSGEQRLVSVVLVSPPSQVAMLDTLLPDEIDTPRRLADRHGAQLRALGDGTLAAALWGSAVATDQAAAGARLALELHAAFPGRVVALAMGRGEVDPRAEVTAFPIGEAIDRAARLLRHSADGVHVDDVTAGLIDGRFQLERAASGFVLAGEGEMLDDMRTLLGRRSPCVGRRRELLLLEGLFDECAADSVARAVIVTAPPGTGKSRLRWELEQRLRGRVEIWLARGEPRSAGSPFAMLAQLVRRAGDLRARIGAEAAELLAQLTTGDRKGSDSEILVEQQRRAWESLISSRAESPLLLVLEDLHWADLPSLRAVDAVLRACAGAGAHGARAGAARGRGAVPAALGGARRERGASLGADPEGLRAAGPRDAGRDRRRGRAANRHLGGGERVPPRGADSRGCRGAR
jgi:hypothetical protein